jgi:hypothetical protein
VFQANSSKPVRTGSRVLLFPSKVTLTCTSEAHLAVGFDVWPQIHRSSRNCELF